MITDDKVELNTYLVDILREQVKVNREFYYSDPDPKNRIHMLFYRAHEPEKPIWEAIAPRARDELWEGLPVIKSIIHYPDGTLDDCIRMRYSLPFSPNIVCDLDQRCRDFGFRLVFLWCEHGNHELICPSETDAILLQSFMVMEIQDEILENT